MAPNLTVLVANRDFPVADDGGRYTYEKQPEICKWNCGKLGEALHPLLPTDVSRPALDELFDAEFDKFYLEKMRLKVRRTGHWAEG